MKTKTIRVYSSRAGHEICFIIEVTKSFSAQQLAILKSKHFSHHGMYTTSGRPMKIKKGKRVIEIRSIPDYQSPSSSKAIRQFNRIGIDSVISCEQARRYHVKKTISTEKFLDTLTWFDSAQHRAYEGKAILKKDEGTSYVKFPKEVKLFGIPKEAALKNLAQQGMTNPSVAKYWYDYFVNVEKRDPKILEVLTPVYGFTEHSKHPHFTGIHMIDGIEHKPLMDVVKSSWKANPGKSVIAFHDNASAVRGGTLNHLAPFTESSDTLFSYISCDMDSTIKAETHNFPTTVAPLPGAETEVGGLMRDIFINGRGGLLVGLFNALAVGACKFPDGYKIFGQNPNLHYPGNIARPETILTQATNGSCDYGNQHGTPTIAGCLSSTQFILSTGERIENMKVIAYGGGIGIMPHDHIVKAKVKAGNLIIGLGGPLYPIGFGGGLASSVAQGTQSFKKDKSAVQRGDALMARNVHNVLTQLVNLSIVHKKKIIRAGNDQGAVGVCNALMELCESVGARVDLSKAHIGAHMSNVQKWLSEPQERYIIVIDQKDQKALEVICRTYGINPEMLGTVVDTGRIFLYDKHEDNVLMDMSFDSFKSADKAIIQGKYVKPFRTEFIPPKNLTLKKALEMTFSQLAVGSKKWVVHKGDQTVGGRTVMHQFSGPRSLTINDTAVIKTSVDPNDYSGVAVGMGYKPNMILADLEKGAVLGVMEAILNLVAGAPSSLKLSDIAFLLNEMWPCGDSIQNERMYCGIKAISEFLIACGLHINGGKDSLSMKTKVGVQEFVQSLETFVAVAYAHVFDVRDTTTPYLKSSDSSIGLVDLSGGEVSLSGSALVQAHGEVGGSYPTIIDPKYFMKSLEFIMELKRRNLVTACHDRLGDGLMVSLVEMLVGGCEGRVIPLDNVENFMRYAFSEAPGMLVEYDPDDYQTISNLANEYGIPFTTVCYFQNLKDGKKVDVLHEGRRTTFFQTELLKMMERTSYEISKKQIGEKLAKEEYKHITRSRVPLPYKVSFELERLPELHRRPKVAVIWGEGSNGMPDMAAYFMEQGLEAHNVPLEFIREGIVSLKNFSMIAIVGGFSYGDVFGSAVGMVAEIIEHPVLHEEFKEFFIRKETLGLGVCNGAQAFLLLDRYFHFMFPSIPLGKRPWLVHNKSGKFEARESRVSIHKGTSVMLQGMENSVLSIPVAHGEGNFNWKGGECDAKMFLKKGLAPLRYADEMNRPAKKYPDNPNGSMQNIAGLCSEDGRFLVSMPHPERFLSMLNASWKEGYDLALKRSPFLKIVENSRKWLLSQQ